VEIRGEFRDSRWRHPGRRMERFGRREKNKGRFPGIDFSNNDTDARQRWQTIPPKRLKYNTSRIVRDLGSGNFACGRRKYKEAPSDFVTGAAGKISYQKREVGTKRDQRKERYVLSGPRTKETHHPEHQTPSFWGTLLVQKLRKGELYFIPFRPPRKAEQDDGRRKGHHKKERAEESGRGSGKS